jgi:hypothetical protein
MKKFATLLVGVMVLVAALASVSVAYAQSPTPAAGTGTGWMGGRASNGISAVGDGLLHEYYVEAFAQALSIPAADLEARLEAGETMAQIALSTVLTLDEFRSLAVDVRLQALNQAVSDGVITQEQADWMSQRGFGQMGARGTGSSGFGSQRGGGMMGQFSNPACPYYTPTAP